MRGFEIEEVWSEWQDLSAEGPHLVANSRTRVRGAVLDPPHVEHRGIELDLQRASEPSSFVFVSERGSPFTTAGFARMIERAATGAGLDIKAHPHMLRHACGHACGYALANKGHDTRAIQGWLGHRSITSTAVYTALAPNRFKDFWRD